MKTTLKGLGVLASLLIAAPGHVLADTNTYAGALCEPQSATTPFSRAVALGIGNPSGTTPSATYLCPLVRDNLPAAVPSVSAAVVVNDFTTSGSITCILASRSETGSTIAASTRATTGPGVGIQTLTFATLPTTATGYLTLHCMVPATATAVGQGTSRVISYRATES